MKRLVSSRALKTVNLEVEDTDLASASDVAVVQDEPL